MKRKMMMALFALVLMTGSMNVFAQEKKEAGHKVTKSFYIQGYTEGRTINQDDISFLNMITGVKTKGAELNKDVTVGDKKIAVGQKLTIEDVKAIEAKKADFTNTHKPEKGTGKDLNKKKNYCPYGVCWYWYQDYYGNWYRYYYCC